MNVSLPILFDKVKSVRTTQDIAEADKYVFFFFEYTDVMYLFPYTELLDGLRKAGFKTNFGSEGSGLFYLVLTRLGGYYFGM